MDRALPADINAERAALGSVFLNREALIVIAPWLEPRHFYLEKHAWIYEAMLDCLKRGVPPDTATISDELRRRERLEPIGGLLYLIDLANSVPTAVHVEYYARTIERTAIHRRVMDAGGRIAAMAFDEDLEMATFETEARKALDGAFARKSDAAVQPISTLAQRAFNRLSSERPIGTPTGFLDLDRWIGGFVPGEMAVIAGRPAMGKTAFMTSLVYRIASRNEPVLVFSLEMPADSLFDRLACAHTGLDYNEMFTHGRVYRDAEAKARYTEAIGYLDTLPIYIDETPGLNVADLQRRAILKTNEVGTFAGIFIDYLQLMTVTGVRPGDEYAVVTEASKAGTATAKLCRAPVIALCQLNRNPEGRSDPAPLLSDLRGSGQIEQDAAKVLFPYREEVYNKETDKIGVAEIIVAKNRNGPTGVIPLRFDGPAMRFLDLAANWQTPEGY